MHIAHDSQSHSPPRSLVLPSRRAHLAALLQARFVPHPIDSLAGELYLSLQSIASTNDPLQVAVLNIAPEMGWW